MTTFLRYAQMNAIRKAGNANVGWRSGSYRTIILISDFEDPLEPDPGSFIREALTKNNILPIYLSHDSFYLSIDFGIALLVDRDYNDLTTKALEVVSYALQSAFPGISNDPNGIVTGISDTILGGDANNSFMDLKTGWALGDSTVNFHQFGWAVTKINAQGII